VLGAALGNCVHVAGLLGFLRLAEQEGYRTISLGAAVPVERLVAEIARLQPDVVAVSYRLTPEVGRRLLEDLAAQLRDRSLLNRRFVFGGTEPVAEEARQVGLFQAIFGAKATPEEVLACLRGQRPEARPINRAGTLAERLARNAGYPLLRHHFGQPTVAATVEGARQIAEAAVLDVLSLGPDQNAQEFFFRPENMRPELDGAGGVPLRRPEDLEAIYQATRCGNYPLLRIYAGTQDLLKWAQLAVSALHNAWGAVPLFWYNRLDGRSSRSLVASIAENQEVMRWYAQQGLPLECNEAHHWSLREAPDAVAVAAAFLGAYNAKAAGVSLYVAQYMFNTPATTWPKMDLAKMLAKRTLIRRLHDAKFTSVTQTRAGLACFRPDPDEAKGQLAASTVLQTALRPQIVHVVGYSEGNHAITAPELIESCRIVHGALAQCREGMPEATADPEVARRCDELIAEAELTLEAIRQLGAGENDPWTDPETLAEAVRRGVLDAPHLAANPEACGQVRTRAVAGAVRAVDAHSGRPLTERQRLESLGIRV
jgi:methylmalonyl-CoA mutase cobalamin-binding subunit